jgi:hypothetical protein
MHHKHHNAVPQAQRLQPQFTVSIPHILAGDGETFKYGLAAQEIKIVVLDVGLALGFVVRDHGQIVDAISRKRKYFVDAAYIEAVVALDDAAALAKLRAADADVYTLEKMVAQFADDIARCLGR